MTSPIILLDVGVFFFRKIFHFSGVLVILQLLDPTVLVDILHIHYTIDRI